MKKIIIGIAAITLVAASVFAYNKTTKKEECKEGSECCFPGSPCCKK